jgi:hypothetical protein
MAAMDCQRCESLLLDLAYGELSSTDEVEARAHLARCAQCGNALERISAGLALAKQMPMEAPPTSLGDSVMRAARAQLAEPTASAGSTLLERIIDVLRRFSMARQVQMATVMLLIVVVGLWSVPELTRRREAQGGTVVGPDDQGEAGPSAALAPAEPLDLAVDRRTGRIRAKGDLPEPSPARAERVVEHAAAASQPIAEAPGAVAAPNKMEETPTNTAPTAPSEAQDDALMAAEGELAVHAFAPPPPAAPEPSAKLARKAAPAADTLALQLDQGTMGGGAAAVLGARGSSLDDAVAEEASRRSAPTSAAAAPSYAAALERFRAGDYRTARDMLRTLMVQDDLANRAGVLLFLARSERALGQCPAAVTRYEPLILRQPTAPEALHALPEAVGCYDQMGRRDAADSLLRRAAVLPALTTRARSLQQARQASAASADALAGDK